MERVSRVAANVTFARVCTAAGRGGARKRHGAWKIGKLAPEAQAARGGRVDCGTAFHERDAIIVESGKV